MAVYIQENRIDSGMVSSISDNVKKAIFDAAYPVGTIFQSVKTTLPSVTLSTGATYGKWTQLTTDYFLMSASSSLGTATAASAPNVKGQITVCRWGDCTNASCSGAFKSSTKDSGIATEQQWAYSGVNTWDFKASNYSSIYVNGGTVLPKYMYVGMWKRITG